jgi:hypothetical protein
MPGAGTKDEIIDGFSWLISSFGSNKPSWILTVPSLLPVSSRLVLDSLIHKAEDTRVLLALLLFENLTMHSEVSAFQTDILSEPPHTTNAGWYG